MKRPLHDRRYKRLAKGLIFSCQRFPDDCTTITLRISPRRPIAGGSWIIRGRRGSRAIRRCWMRWSSRVTPAPSWGLTAFCLPTQGAGSLSYPAEIEVVGFLRSGGFERPRLHQSRGRPGSATWAASWPPGSALPGPADTQSEERDKSQGGSPPTAARAESASMEAGGESGDGSRPGGARTLAWTWSSIRTYPPT